MSISVTEPRRAARTSRRRLAVDRAARWIVTAGGLAIIASILGILVFILAQVRPLIGSARVSVVGGFTLPAPDALAIVGDEYRTHLAVLGGDGVCRVVRVADGTVVLEAPVLAGPIVRADATPGTNLLTASSSDGRVVLVPVTFETGFRGQDRVVTPHVPEAEVFDVDPDHRPVRAYAAQHDSESGVSTVAAAVGGMIVVVRHEVRRNALTGERTESVTRRQVEAPEGLTHLVLDGAQRDLFGGTRDGALAWWSIRDGEPGEPRSFPAGGSEVTALSFLIGDRALVVGQADGSISVWFPVRQEDQTFELTRIRDFPRHPGPVRLIAPSRRDKGFLAQDDGGRLGLYYSTSHRVLWTGGSPLPRATALFYAPKGDGAYLAGGGRIAALDVNDPHPEVSIRSLFGKVWYEGYEKPEYAWQSTGGTEDFEPKLSLTPLLIGTLKGTAFSLVLAIPLGVLAAMYASQFMHPSLKRFVKPTVEIMAALPSVVLGFLAGLWLAPRVERVFPSLLLMVPVLALLVLGGRYLWHLVPRGLRGRVPVGSEVTIYVVLLALGIWICLKLSGPFEAIFFHGSFPTWLLRATGLNYDQRNAIVVGIAMGFAVIPIIFAISEDAFSNVPRSLVSGSLALGANRWQTVTRIVLPTASPGIFSAVMVGFGRAVGETMIVLMATGNTPILSWNPFNGFRTLSANIAVEIPEAPQGGTLYRTLFLAALLLFVMTFVVNTAAELVRQRLRRRYAQL